MCIGGWPGGKPTERGCSDEVVQAKGPRVADEHAENAAAVRGIADLALHLRRHPVGHEALEAGSGGVDHAEGRVVRCGDPGGGFDDPLENAVERQLGVDRDPGLDERPEAVGFFPRSVMPASSRKASVVSRKRSSGSSSEDRRASADGASSRGGLTADDPGTTTKELEARDEHHHS